MALFLPFLENVEHHVPGMALPLPEDEDDEKPKVARNEAITITLFSSNRTRVPLPSIDLAPSAVKRASIRLHSNVVGTGILKISFRVF